MAEKIELDAGSNRPTNTTKVEARVFCLLLESKKKKDETQIQSVESADSSIEEEMANGDEEQLNEDIPHLFKVGRFLLIT